MNNIGNIFCFPFLNCNYDLNDDIKQINQKKMDFYPPHTSYEKWALAYKTYSSMNVFI